MPVCARERQARVSTCSPSMEASAKPRRLARMAFRESSCPAAKGPRLAGLSSRSLSHGIFALHDSPTSHPFKLHEYVLYLQFATSHASHLVKGCKFATVHRPKSRRCELFEFAFPRA